MDFWAVFTKLADTNFSLPVALLLAVWLAFAREWRLAFWWCALFGFGLLLVTATKVAYVGWGIGIASVDFRGFSGHAMRAATIAPALGYLLLQRWGMHMRRSGFLLGAAFAIAICISRLILAVHSVSEAVSGLLLGLLLSLIFVMICGRSRLIQLTRIALVLGPIFLLPVLLAKPAPTQGWIEDVAMHLAGDQQRESIRRRLGKPSSTTETENIQPQTK